MEQNVKTVSLHPTFSLLVWEKQSSGLVRWLLTVYSATQAPFILFSYCNFDFSTWSKKKKKFSLKPKYADMNHLEIYELQQIYILAHGK